MISLVSLFCLFAFCGAFILKGFILKKQGIRSFRLGVKDKGKISTGTERGLNIFFGLWVLFWLVGIVKWNGFAGGLAFYTNEIPRYIGSALCVLGMVIFVLAMIFMGRSWRAGIDPGKTALVTKGLYRFSRNPAFVGFDLLFIGSALAYPYLLLWIVSPAAVMLVHMQIIHEEAHLIKMHGKKYSAYMEHSPRYLFFRQGKNR
jgi:protein-S-isoprenylcysteine O-methyltransferase Ste14